MVPPQNIYVKVPNELALALWSAETTYILSIALSPIFTFLLFLSFMNLK